MVWLSHSSISALLTRLVGIVVDDKEALLRFGLDLGDRKLAVAVDVEPAERFLAARYSRSA